MVTITLNHLIAATFAWTIAIAVVYAHSGYDKIRDCYAMWFTREYWTNYNTVEFVSWLAKAIIIVPGLIWGIQIWQLYILTLATSLSLIWASNKKLLPTLVGFNTIWAWISIVVITSHIL